MIHRVALLKSGECRYWSGGKNVEVDGETYVPGILVVPTISTSAAFSNSTYTIELAEHACNDFLNRTSIFNDITIWRADVVDEEVVNQVILFKGIMLRVKKQDGQYELEVGSRLQKILKRERRKWSHQYWLDKHPGDNWFEDLSTLEREGQKIEWPRI